MTMPMTAEPEPAREPQPRALSFARIARLGRLLLASRAAAADEMAPPHARDALARIDCFLADHILPALAAIEPLAESAGRSLPDLRQDPAAFFNELVDTLLLLRGDLLDERACHPDPEDGDPLSPATMLGCALDHLPERAIIKLREPVPGLNLRADSPETRRMLQDLVLRDKLRGREPAGAQVEIHHLHGRWLAAWLAQPDTKFELDRWEVDLIGEHPEKPGVLVYSDL